MNPSDARRAHREQVTVETLDYDADSELICRRLYCVHVEGNQWSVVGLVSLGSVEGFTIEQMTDLRDKHINGTA